MKLATWNVNRPVKASRREAMQQYLRAVQADVLVLTETHDGFTPGYAYSHSSSGGRDGGFSAEHRWATILSNWYLEPLDTSDAVRTVAARVFPEADEPFVVYGTVLPWRSNKWRQYPTVGGVAFREALRLQADDWQQLRRQFPDDEFFVLGDCNQDLVGSANFGTVRNRLLLESVLDECGLVALTGGRHDPVFRDSPPWASVDHVCAKVDSRWQPLATERWPELPNLLGAPSDHYGVSVLLACEAM